MDKTIYETSTEDVFGDASLAGRLSADILSLGQSAQAVQLMEPGSEGLPSVEPLGQELNFRERMVLSYRRHPVTETLLGASALFSLGIVAGVSTVAAAHRIRSHRHLLPN